MSYKTLGIIDINGNVVVKYDCDAFDNIKSITVNQDIMYLNGVDG